MDEKQAILRELPSVDSLLRTPAGKALVDSYGQMLTTQVIRQTIGIYRQQILNGEEEMPAKNNTILSQVHQTLQTLSTPTLQPVINATGVILHTNLGRAPLSQPAIQAIERVTSGYSNLEYDEKIGERGSRSIHAQGLLQQITQAEAVFVANNNASAVLLMLSALCAGGEVIIEPWAVGGDWWGFSSARCDGTVGL